jgi:hypothetical protein
LEREREIERGREARKKRRAINLTFKDIVWSTWRGKKTHLAPVTGACLAGLCCHVWSAAAVRQCGPDTATKGHWLIGTIPYLTTLGEYSRCRKFQHSPQNRTCGSCCSDRVTKSVWWLPTVLILRHASWIGVNRCSQHTFRLTVLYINVFHSVYSVAQRFPECTVPKGSATSSQEICGYISVMATWKFAYFLIKWMMFW